MVVLYVDDLLLAGNYEARLRKIKAKLSGNFEMRNLSDPYNFRACKLSEIEKEKILVLRRGTYYKDFR